ncbi:MAG: hypothetical protein PHV30_10540 [Candidatus Margulisbacteria bacterium]|nr:hypothetical protein [Candidatus Margulisiibacteriota bacterium]
MYKKLIADSYKNTIRLSGYIKSDFSVRMEYSHEQALAALEERQMLSENIGLTSEAKEFIKNLVLSQRGPWSVPGHVSAITEDHGKITVKHTNGEHYYYLPVTIAQKTSFIKNSVEQNPGLTEKAKQFMRTAILTSPIFSTKNRISDKTLISQAGGTITVKCADELTAFFYLPATVLQKEKFIKKFVDHNDELSKRGKRFIKNIIKNDGFFSIEENLNLITGIIEIKGRIILTTTSSVNRDFNIPASKFDLKKFIKQNINNNQKLSEEAKQFMRDVVQKNRGPWSILGHVQNISQSGNQIIVKHTNGEHYYYLPKSPKSKESQAVVPGMMLVVLSNPDISRQMPTVMHFSKKEILDFFSEIVDKLSANPDEKVSKSLTICVKNLRESNMEQVAQRLKRDFQRLDMIFTNQFINNLLDMIINKKGLSLNIRQDILNILSNEGKGSSNKLIAGVVDINKTDTNGAPQEVTPVIAKKSEKAKFTEKELLAKPINPTFNEFASEEMLKTYPFKQFSTLGEVLATMSQKETKDLLEKMTLFLVQSINKFTDLTEPALMQMSVRLTPKEQVVLTCLTHQEGWRHSSEKVEAHYQALQDYLKNKLSSEVNADIPEKVEKETVSQNSAGKSFNDFNSYKANSGELSEEQFNRIMAHHFSQEEYGKAFKILSSALRELHGKNTLDTLPDHSDVEMAAKILGSLEDTELPKDMDGHIHPMWILTETNLLQGKSADKINEMLMKSLGF